MEIPRGSVIVSRCSLKYIKDQTSCERGKSERVCKGEKVLLPLIFLKKKKERGVLTSVMGVFYFETTLWLRRPTQLIRGLQEEETRKKTNDLILILKQNFLMTKKLLLES